MKTSLPKLLPPPPKTPDENFLVIIGVKAAVIQLITIKLINSSTNENANFFFNSI